MQGEVGMGPLDKHLLDNNEKVAGGGDDGGDFYPAYRDGEGYKCPCPKCDADSASFVARPPSMGEMAAVARTEA